MLRYSPSSGDPRIQSTEWLNISLGYQPGARRDARRGWSRLRPRGRGYSSRNFFSTPSVFYFYLRNRPASPYKLPFVPLISPRSLARTYLIRINARAAWKLASRSVRARHLACRSPPLLLIPSSVSYVTTGNNLAVQGAKTRIVRASLHKHFDREREKERRKREIELR